MRSTSEIKFLTANLLKEFEILSLGCSNIDKLLKGGFRSNVLNEIAGDSGSGKTQICLVLSLIVQLPKRFGGLDKAAVYICTEKVFPIKRLHQLNCWFQQKYGTTKNFLDNIFIQHIPDYEVLMKALHIHLPNLLKMKDIGLIVIDSIAGIFRSDNLEVSYVNRSKQLNEIALILRQFGAKYCCVIICVNQVIFTFIGNIS
ncbi:hypothetical protein WA026_006640 [Henosepilachna vigintioctopunctata]|uniref:RecA family profile 1 domain-containing protein n=1 Tax=Henosepilachna vigintioctopunctata TaxID=420089 RepID=A0AAW1UHG5_9CUCU